MISASQSFMLPIFNLARFLNNTFRQFLKFAVVGAINTSIDFILFGIFLYLFELPLILANSIGYCVGTLNGFFMNKYWTFSKTKENNRTSRQLPVFFFLYFIGLGLSNIVVWLLAPFMPILLAKIWATGAALIWNFWSSRRFVYKAQPSLSLHP